MEFCISFCYTHGQMHDLYSWMLFHQGDYLKSCGCCHTAIQIFCIMVHSMHTCFVFLQTLCSCIDKFEYERIIVHLYRDGGKEYTCDATLGSCLMNQPTGCRWTLYCFKYLLEAFNITICQLFHCFPGLNCGEDNEELTTWNHPVKEITGGIKVLWLQMAIIILYVLLWSLVLYLATAFNFCQWFQKIKFDLQFINLSSNR